MPLTHDIGVRIPYPLHENGTFSISRPQNRIYSGYAETRKRANCIRTERVETFRFFFLRSPHAHEAPQSIFFISSGTASADLLLSQHLPNPRPKQPITKQPQHPITTNNHDGIPTELNKKENFSDFYKLSLTLRSCNAPPKITIDENSHCPVELHHR